MMGESLTLTAVFTPDENGSYRAEGRELPIGAGHVETLTIDTAA